MVPSVISSLRRHVDEICALRGYYATSGGNRLPIFQDNVSVPSSRVKKSVLSTHLVRHVPCLDRIRGVERNLCDSSSTRWNLGMVFKKSHIFVWSNFQILVQDFLHFRIFNWCQGVVNTV
jgi:hypothetical protein